MGSMNVYFDLPSFARKHLKGCIDTFHLIEGKLGGERTTLSNQLCTIYLSNLEDVVGFDFAPIDSPERKFDLRTFLNAIIAGGAARHFPAWPRNMPKEEKFRACLDAFAELVNAGAMDAPLSGDFSWSTKYDEFEAEHDRLENILAAFPMSKDSETIPIYQKRMAFDLTWMDDVKRFLAEQGS